MEQPLKKQKVWITAVHKERFEILFENGQTGFAKLKAGIYYGQGNEEFPTVGDWVEIEENVYGDSLILHTFPRHSFFFLLDPYPGAREQAIAANFDYVFLLQSMNQNFNVKRLERYGTLAWQSGAIPVVILTKSDLVPDAVPYLQQARAAVPGAEVHIISVKTGEGLPAVRDYFRGGKTAVLLGSSGVGKSSLVNALMGNAAMKVSGIREEDGRGHHTTTHRQLLALPEGGYIMDTPGMRTLIMWEITTGLEDEFPEIRALATQCRFRDCRHEDEPGCAVQRAIQNGELDPQRLRVYRQLQQEGKNVPQKREQKGKRKEDMLRKKGKKAEKNWKIE